MNRDIDTISYAYYSKCKLRDMSSHFIQWPGPPNENSGYVWLWSSCLCIQLPMVSYSVVCKAR